MYLQTGYNIRFWSKSVSNSLIWNSGNSVLCTTWLTCLWTWLSLKDCLTSDLHPGFVLINAAIGPSLAVEQGAFIHCCFAAFWSTERRAALRRAPTCFADLHGQFSQFPLQHWLLLLGNGHLLPLLLVRLAALGALEGLHLHGSGAVRFLYCENHMKNNGNDKAAALESWI